MGGDRYQAVTGGFSENVSEQWADYKLMYDWMIANIPYSYDSPLPFLPPSPSMSELSWRDEYWRMPGETFSNTFYETFDTTAAFVDWALAR